MDPKALIFNAIEELKNGSYGNAMRLLQDYKTWRKKGGFRPNFNGDDLADALYGIAETKRRKKKARQEKNGFTSQSNAMMETQDGQFQRYER